MMIAKSLISGLGLSLLVSLSFTPGATAQEPQKEVGEECLLTLQPDTISPQEEPIEIQVDFPLALGAITSIDVEEASGLVTLETRVQEADTVLFALDSSKAASGTWILVFQTDRGECRAVLKVS